MYSLVKVSPTFQYLVSEVITIFNILSKSVIAFPVVLMSHCWRSSMLIIRVILAGGQCL